MVRYYCDFCGDELTDRNRVSGGRHSSSRLGTTLSKGSVTLKVEIMHSLNGTANEGIVCKYCILNALSKLDDRPEAG